MKKAKLVLLVVANNDYQTEQTTVAKQAGHENEADLQIIQTDHDAVAQSQEVLKLLHSPAGTRPDGVLFEPVGTPLERAAKIAASSGVGRVVLNREVDYLKELRRECATLFSPLLLTTRRSAVSRANRS